jgi:hypothetical protein
MFLEVKIHQVAPNKEMLIIITFGGAKQRDKSAIY